jgi:hypothetical protein
MVEFDYLELCKSERVRASAMHVNKIRMMNDNFELFFQKVLMFEKYLVMPSHCSSIFS